MEPLTANWAGGESEFLLRLGELEALDDLTDSGVLDLRYRLAQGQARGSLAYAPVKVREVIACLRLGLIGGGMDRKDAERKVTLAFDRADISELNLLAYSIISHSLAGKGHDPLGEVEAGEAYSGSASPAYTATEPPSDSLHPK